MDDDQMQAPQLAALRKWIHDLNNHVGVILLTAELLQLDQLPPKASERGKAIEDSALEARGILQAMSAHYFD